MTLYNQNLHFGKLIHDTESLMGKEKLEQILKSHCTEDVKNNNLIIGNFIKENGLEKTKHFIYRQFLKQIQKQYLTYVAHTNQETNSELKPVYFTTLDDIDIFSDFELKNQKNKQKLITKISTLIPEYFTTPFYLLVLSQATHINPSQSESIIIEGTYRDSEGKIPMFRQTQEYFVLQNQELEIHNPDWNIYNQRENFLNLIKNKIQNISAQNSNPCLAINIYSHPVNKQTPPPMKKVA